MSKTASTQSLAGTRVLVLDDQEVMRRFLQRVLSAQGCLVETVRNGKEGLQVLLRQDFDVAILDLRMPEMDGMAFLQEARKIWPWLGIIITSGYLDERDVLKARSAGVEHVLPKPVEVNSLLAAVRAEATLKNQRTRLQSSDLFDRMQQQLGVLRQIGESAVEAQNLGQALQGLGLGISRIMSCEAVGILAVDAEERVLQVKLNSPQPQAVVGRVIGELIARYRVLTARDLSLDMLKVEIDGQVDDAERAKEIRSLTTVPVIAAGEVCGLLMLADFKPDAFSTTDITFLYHAANHLSMLMTALSRMRELTIRDCMTGLYNRRHMDAELQRFISMARRYRLPMSVILLDIDHFKQINDQLGHSAGDRVIRQIGKLLQALVRASDLVGRQGGDEFLLLLPKTDVDGAQGLAARIREEVAAGNFGSTENPRPLTLSLGTATILPDDALASSEEILVRADKALYAAKRAGRNRVCSWETLRSDAPDIQTDLVDMPAPLPDARNARVLVVDDDAALGLLVTRMLQSAGHAAESYESAAAGLTALKRPADEFDVVLADLSLPGEDGFQFLKEVAELDSSLVRVVMTGHATLDNAITALRHGAYDFISKPFVREQLLAVIQRAQQFRRLVIDNQRYQRYLEDMVAAKKAEVASALEDIKRSYDFTLEALVAMLDAREFETCQHSVRVRDLTLILARHLGVPDDQLLDIGRGALLHDIGKIGIPDAVLLKPGALTEEEWMVIKQHPKIGANFLRNSPFLKPAAEIVLSHHEHVDGSGYPRGLVGDQICIGARIFAIIDVYDAMRSPRRYKKPLSQEEASAEIRSQIGRHFDPEVVRCFFECQARLEEVGLWSLSADPAL